jgi:hypothetical protein
MVTHRSSWLVVIVACVVATDSARAQDSAATGPDPWVIAINFGLPGHRSQTALELFTLGVQVTQLRPNRLSADLAFGTVPYALAAGFGVFAFRGGVALPLRLSPESWFVPSAGVSGIGTTSEGQGDGALGVNAGFGLILLSGNRSGGVRVGATWHWLHKLNGSIWLLEVGIIP